MKRFPSRLARRARGRWLALLFGAALAVGPIRASAGPPELAPDGFVWEELKAIHAHILRPEKWLLRCVIPASPFYECSPEPFTGPVGVYKGVGIHVMARTDQPADDVAAARIAQIGSGYRVLREQTKKDVPAMPFTTYTLVCEMQGEETDGVKCIAEIVFVAKRVTNTVYQCWLVAPTDQWKDVEQAGETLLANLRLDPEF